MRRSSRAVVVEAARRVGLAASSGRLLRDGSHALYTLTDGIVARVGPPGSSTRAHREVQIATWLGRSGIATVEPIATVAQPTQVDDRPVTWWRELRAHRQATPAELGALLRALHQLAIPTRPTLPDLDPFTGFAQRIHGTDWPVATDRDWLLAQLAKLRRRWATLPASRGRCVVHGDAWQGNVAVPADGQPVLLDLEHVAIGPPEWDLIPVAVDHTDFSRLDASDYHSFVDAYGGYDVTTWPGYRTLADIMQLRWVCFALAKAAGDDEAAEQARHRLACLRGEIPRPWTWKAL